MTDLALMLAVIGLVSLGSQWLAWNIAKPAILILLLAGLILGPGLGVLRPDDLFKDLLFPLISLSVAVILFEGALTLKFEEIKDNPQVVRRLISSAMLLDWAIIGLAAWFFLGLSPSLAALLGALLVVTGPTVIVPMLRSVRPTDKVASILRWEGILIDPLGALLAVLVYEYVLAVNEGISVAHSFLVFGQTIGAGLLIGGFAGYALGLVLRRHWLPHYLINLGVLTWVLGAYAISNHFFHESGLLTVTVMGVLLANMKKIEVEDILEFKETLSVLLISGLFIILAARLEIGSMLSLGLASLAFLAVVMWVARPISVFFAARKSGLSWQEKVILSWIGPRGIVAAAVSALFAIKLEVFNIADVDKLVPLVFLVIIGSVLIQSLTARPLAVWLNAVAPEPTGFLILGANKPAREIAKVLKRQKVRVLLADTNWDAVQEARMEELDVYFGNPLSEDAKVHLNLTAIAKLLVMSPQRQLNAQVSYHFLSQFGVGNVYCLNEQQDSNRQNSAQFWQKIKPLFDGKITYGKLASLVSKGGQVKETGLTEEFGYEEYLARQGNGSIPLFAVDNKGKIRFFHTKHTLVPESGWRMVSLLPVEKLAEEAQKKASEKLNEAIESKATSEEEVAKQEINLKKALEKTASTNISNQPKQTESNGESGIKKLGEAEEQAEKNKENKDNKENKAKV